MSGLKKYAILYLRPDGYWIAEEGWEDMDIALVEGEQTIGPNIKVVEVESAEYIEAARTEMKSALWR